MERSKLYAIPGQPIPLARPRFSNNHVWDCQIKEKNNAVAYLHFLHKGEEMFDGPLHVDLKFFLCHKTKHKSWHCVRPDLDNLVKFILDVANGVLYEDDKQVAKITAEKMYDQEARTEITISKLDSKLEERVPITNELLEKIKNQRINQALTRDYQRRKKEECSQ